MKFLQPDILFHLLWILPVVVLLIFLGIARRRKVLAQFLGSEMGDRLSTNASPKKRIYKQICFLIGVVLLAIAAARPGWGTKLVEEPVQSRDIMLVLDTSRSMLADDIKPTRLAHAKWWIRDLIKKSEGDRFGLICFAGMAAQNCPLTMEPDTFFSFLDDINTDTIPKGGTNIQLALEKAVESFKGAEGEHKAIVLLTDGDELEGKSATILEKLKSTHIPVHVVGIGDPNGPGIIRLPNGNYLRNSRDEIVKSKLNENGLKALATATNGTYVRTSSIDPGVEVINDRLEELIPQGTKKVKKERIIERYQYPLLGAIIFFMLQMLIRERKKESVKIAALLMAAALFTANNVHAQDNNLVSPKGDKKATKKPQPKKEVIPEIAAIEKRINKENVKEKPNQALLSRLKYNLGVISQKHKLYDEAKDAYIEATSSPEAEVKSRAFQNLAALKHQKAKQEIQEDTDDAITDLTDVIPDYREALKADPKNHEAAENLEKLYSHLAKAKYIKKMKEEMEKLKKQTQDKTKDAQKKQKKSNDEKKQQKQGQKSQKQKQGDKSQKQQQKQGQKSQKQKQGQKQGQDSQQSQQSQATKATKSAAQSAQKLRDLADKLKSKDSGKFKDAADELEKAAKKQENLDKLSEEGQKKSKKEIMKHLNNAMKKMREAKGDKKKGDKDKKDSKEGDQKGKQKKGDKSDKKDGKDGDKKSANNQNKKGKPNKNNSEKRGKRKKASKAEVDRLLREASMNEEQLRKLMKQRDKERKGRFLKKVNKNW